MKFFIFYLFIILSVDFSMESSCESLNCEMRSKCEIQSRFFDSVDDCLKKGFNYIAFNSDIKLVPACCSDNILSEDELVDNKYLQDSRRKDLSCIHQVIFQNKHKYDIDWKNCLEFARGEDYY